MANPASLSPPETGAIHDSDAPQSPSRSSLASRSLEEALRRRDGQSSFFRIRPVDQSTPTKRQWGAKVLSSTSSGVSRLDVEFQMFEDVGLHPNILRVPGLSVMRNGMSALVMEAGECSMATFYKNLGYDVPRSTTARLVLEVAKAIKHMHSHEVYHNDLNAEHVIIFLGDDGIPTAKLTNFASATKSWPSLVSGTIAAMPPENIHARFVHSWLRKSGQLDLISDDLLNMDRCNGVHTAGERDVWGIGIVLFEALFGCYPSSFSDLSKVVFVEESMLVDPKLVALARTDVLLSRQRSEVIKSAWTRELAPQLKDSPFRKLLTSCLSIAPGRPSVSEVISALEKLLSDPSALDNTSAH